MIQKIVLTSLLLLVNACATVNVDVDYDGQADFSRLSRYAWLDDKAPLSGNALIDTNTLLHDRIRGGVKSWFESNGYLLAAQKDADFLVVYRVVVENHTRVTVLNPYYGYPYSWRYGYRRGYYSSFAWNYYPEQRVYEYQRGTLIIDIVDPNTKKLMWRGMAFEDINPNASQQKKEAYVARAIKAILSRFPPEKR
jgi:uncharacterized protein DUF4136